MKLSNTLFLLLFSVCVFAQDFNTEVVSDRLFRQLQSDKDYHHISILLTDRLDVQSIDQAFYHQKATLEERAAVLIPSLKEKAATAQQDLLLFLYQNEGVDQASINAYWITNLIFVKAKKEVIEQLSYRDDVEWMDINAKLEVTDYKDVTPAISFELDGIEPGLEAINAPAMWELGYSGYGLTAFVNDTGVDPGHPAFKLNFGAIMLPLLQPGLNTAHPTHIPTIAVIMAPMCLEQ